MSDCPLVRLVKNRKILKTFEQTGKVTIPISEWLFFFEALTTIAHDSGRREIYCAIGARYLVFSKTPVEREAKTRPTQNELFER
jgi:hypothetical protein